MTPRRHQLVLAVGAALALAGAVLAQDNEYTLVNIGTFGGPSSQALGINDHGVVVGWADHATHGRHAFAWDDGVMTDLGVLGQNWSQARGINTRGMIVGQSATDEGEPHAFLYMRGVMYDLNDLLAYQTPPAAESNACSAPLRVMFEANAINDDGVIVGCGYVYADEAPYAYLMVPLPSTGMQHVPVLYSYTNLGRLHEAWDCVASDVNDVETVVGHSGERAFLWMEGRMSEMEREFSISRAEAINGWGEVAGWVGSEARTAAVWTFKGRRLLGTPDGWESQALDISDAGTVVGWGYDLGAPFGWQVATVWYGNEMVDLNQRLDEPSDPAFLPYMHLESAEAVDAAGRIAGSGRLLSNGELRAFVLLPSPRD